MRPSRILPGRGVRPTSSKPPFSFISFDFPCILQYFADFCRFPLIFLPLLPQIADSDAFLLLLLPQIAGSDACFLPLLPQTADSDAFVLLLLLQIADSDAFLLILLPQIADSDALLLLLLPQIADSDAVCCTCRFILLILPPFAA